MTRIERRTVDELDEEASRKFKETPLLAIDAEMLDEFFNSVDGFTKGICNAGEIGPSPYLFMFKKQSDEMGIGITTELNRNSAIAWGMIDDNDEYTGIPDGYLLARKIMDDYKPQAIAIVSALTFDKHNHTGGVSIHGISFDKSWDRKTCYTAKLKMDENNCIQKWVLTESHDNMVPDLDTAIGESIFHTCENCGGDGC